MRTRSIAAALALAMSGSACAQVPPPAAPTHAPAPPQAAPQPPAGVAPLSAPVPVPLANALPPLPPGCVTMAPPAPQPPTMAVSDIAFETALSLSRSQAAQVRQIFEQRATRQQQLDQKRRDLDASTCRNLRNIVGDQGLARWWSLIPPPPPPGGPGRRPPPPPPAGMAPPPPPPVGD